jgi:hypothetical protein
MFPTSQAIGRAATIARRSGATWLAAAVLVVAALSGCSVVRTINNVRHAVDSNRSTINTFTSGLKSSEATPFSATYVTSGQSPVTVTYAVQPPKEVAFSQTSPGNTSGTADLDLVSNDNGEYSCTSSGGTSGWSCQKLNKAEAVAQNQIVGLYTPSHWVTFLDAFSVAAGVAGDKVTTSTMSLNGFSMKCVDFNAKGVKGTSTICTTAQNILGYVKVAGGPTSFELKSYTTSPAASLFQLPAGAKITSN